MGVYGCFLHRKGCIRLVNSLCALKLVYYIGNTPYMAESGITNNKWYAFKDEIDAEIKKNSLAKNNEIAKIILKRHNIADSQYLRQWIGRYKRSRTYEDSNLAKVKKTIVSKESKEKPFVLSAWNQSTGLMMDIDEYCKHYKLPRKDIKSYKLVSHTGTPYYNILFKENHEIETEDIEVILNRVFADKHLVKKSIIPESETTDRLIYTDVHTGMDASRKGLALYSADWNEKELNLRIDIMINTMIKEKRSDVLIVDELGDYMDGWDGETTRGGHKLPQNMTNEEAYDIGLSAKVRLANELSKHWKHVVFNNINDDNHAGAFAYTINSAFKRIVDVTISNVEVVNHRKFINHYYIGRHCFVITHGKDSRNLKLGLKPKLDPKQIETIDQYLKNNDVYKNAQYIEIAKGDSHQFLLDISSSDDFEYLNLMAFSPSSEWVQTNFKKGRSGFYIQRIHNELNRKDSTPFWF